MVSFDKSTAEPPHEHERVLVARTWREREGFRARLTVADLTQVDPQRTSVVVSSPDEALRVVRDWLRAYDHPRKPPRLRWFAHPFRRRRG